MTKSFQKLIAGIWITWVVYFFPQCVFAGPSPEGIQVYQKNMHLSEEHKQKLAADIYRYYKAENIWDVLRHEFVLPHYEYMPQVQAQINWFLLHQDFLITSASRAAPYLYYILQQVHKRHLPPELVLLPMMESSYNPFAYSNRGAAGLWQIMPGTASGFGVKQTWWYDGRRDLVTSTQTALDYLSYLGNFFGGNWLLAIAAYDTGEGNILSAIKKNIRVGVSTDYWSLPLVQETKDYIPRLLAMAIIISNPERYPILFPPVRNAPYLAQIDIGGQIDLKQAAGLAGLSLKKLMHLNPGYNRATTDPDGPFKIILPIEHVQQFSENLEHAPYLQSIRWHHYKIKIGDTWASIAKRFNTSIQALRKTNQKLASRLQPGKQLIIPQTNQSIENVMESYHPTFFTSNTHGNNSRSPFSKKLNRNTMQKDNAGEDIFIVSNLNANQNSDNNTIANTLTNLQGKYSLQPGDTLYMIREGDDLSKIAKRFGLDTQTIVAVNQSISQNGLVPGEKIIIPTHLAEVASVQSYPLTSGETIYSVKQGDNIDTIAQQFHTTPDAIRIANLLTSNQLQIGDRLVIPQVG